MPRRRILIRPDPSKASTEGGNATSFQAYGVAAPAEATFVVLTARGLVCRVDWSSFCFMDVVFDRNIE